MAVPVMFECCGFGICCVPFVTIAALSGFTYALPDLRIMDCHLHNHADRSAEALNHFPLLDN